MMRSFFAAISGLRVHQTMLDVTANNIANVNTIGFKGDRISFADALSQMQSGGSAPSASLGGTNPSQIGLGVQIGGITSEMTSGAIQSTGNPLDLAIQGEGWFRVAQAAGGGGFTTPLFTRAGNFTTDETGTLVTQDGYYVLGHAYNAGTSTYGTTDAKLTVPAGAKSIAIDQNGILSYVDGTTGQTMIAGKLTLQKFPNEAGLERVSSTMYAAGPNAQDPDPTKQVIGVVGDTNGFGTIAPGSLEMSNVDLAQQFTEMITAQRGFQANSRVITTADQILQDLVNIGR